VAALLGEALPRARDIPPAATDLVERVRELVDAVLCTDIDAAERAAVAAEVETLTARLRAARRPGSMMIARFDDGWVENLTQAATGPLNPLASRATYLDAAGNAGPRPSPPGPGDPPGLVRMRVVLSRAHGGPPGRAHGGSVAMLLDQVLGMSVAAAGRPGMTVGLTVRFRRATPLHVPLLVTARLTGEEGRKRFAEGEITVEDGDGTVTASGSGVFVATPGTPAAPSPL
jgi:acyl-coenzyme A thioesterase PaaI-like protein